jgi:hypothetical protein
MKKTNIAPLVIIILCLIYANSAKSQQCPEYNPTNITVSFKVNGFIGFAQDSSYLDLSGSNLIYNLYGQGFTNAADGFIEVTTNESEMPLVNTPWVAIKEVLRAFKRMDTNALVLLTSEAGQAKIITNLVDSSRRSALENMFAHLTGAVVVVGYDRPPLGFVTHVRLLYDNDSAALSPFLWQVENGQYRMAPFSGALSPLEINMATGLKTNGFGGVVNYSR